MKKFKLFKALMLIVSIMLISPQVWGETCATMAKSGWDKLSSTNRKYELGTGFYIYDCSGNGDTLTSGTTKYGNSFQIDKSGTKSYAINAQRLLFKFPEQVSSITIYGYNSSDRALSSIKTNSYLTGSSSDRKAHPWSPVMTGTTDYTTSASKDANFQHVITINFVSGHEPAADKYIWVELNNALNMYSFCYTSASTAKYSLAYDANGGTGSMPAHDFVSGTTVYAGQNAGFTPPTGKIFKCWNTKANGSGTEYKEGDSFTLNANTTLYAQWITASTKDTYCISMYNLNVSDQMKYFTYSGYDDMQILDLEVPDYKTSTNNFWVGKGGSWKSGDLGNSGASSANERLEDLCLKGNRGTKLGTGSQGVLARFFVYDNSTYNNIYIEFTPKQYSLIWGEEGKSWDPVKLYPSGYENEWTSEVVTLTSDHISNDNWKYYVGILKADDGVAYWYKSKTEIISSMGTYNKRTDSWGGNVSTLSAGAKGFFRMWQDATSYDNWRCHFVPVYTLSYNANSGSGAPANAYVATEGDAAARTLKVSMTEPTRNGYSFEGWATSSANASAGTVAYDPGDNITLSADVELWAVWTCVDPTIGTDLSESQVDYNVGDAATALSVAATAAGGTVSYQWYSNTAKSTSSPTPTSLTTGTSYTPSTAAAGTTYYFCKMTNSTAGCSNVVYSKIAKVVVSRVNPTQYTVSGTASICAGGNTDITLSGSQVGASYQLKIGGVATGDPKAGTGSALTWNVSTTGTYTVSAVQTTKYLARDMSGSATVSAKTATSVSFSDYTLDATVDEEFEITGISAAGDGTLTYQWYSYSDAEGNGEAEIGGAESSTYTFTPDDETDYYFKCEVTGTCGSVKSSMIIVTATDVVTYTVTYDDNGADSGTAPTDSYSPYESDATVTVLGNTGSLAKAFDEVSATFLGWNTNSDTYSGTHYDAGDEFSITENTTLYPVWGYSISYSTDGGTINDASYSTYYICTYPDGDVTTSLPSDVTKEGCTFDGWKTENGNGTIITEIDGSYVGSFSGDYALKAMWTLNAYHVTYAAGVTLTSGSVPTDATAYNGDGTESVTVAGNTGSMVYTGYTFRGWKYNGTFYLPGQSFTMPAANVTVTAVWEPNSIPATTVADINFASWTTEEVSAGGTSHGLYFKSATTVTNGTGLSFGGNVTTSSNFISIPLENVNGAITVTLTGLTNKKHQYKYSIETGTSAVANKTSAPTLSTSTRDNDNTTTHSFTISNLKAGDTYARLYIGRASADDAQVGRITITTPGVVNHFDVEFKDGSTAPESHTTWPDDILGVEKNLKILAPVDGEADYYTFDSWVTTSSGSTEFDFENTTITEDTKIYAKWHTNTRITTQPATSVDGIVNETYTLGTGMVAVGENVEYQWYTCDENGENLDDIDGKTSSTMTASQTSAGSYYYKVKVHGDYGDDVYSDMITVTVVDPCFRFKAGTTKNSEPSAGASITTANWKAGSPVLTGGTMTNTSSDKLGINNSNGLVFDGDGKEVTVTLTGGNSFGVGTVITIGAKGTDSEESHTCGFTINGVAPTPATVTSSTSSNSFTQTYTVTADDGVDGEVTIVLKRKASTSKVYLNTLTITGCADCTPIHPSLSYSKTSFWMDDATKTASPTLSGYYGSPTITYASSDATIVSVNESTGAITALKRGEATITATIGEATVSTTDYCGRTAKCDITVKDISCSEDVIIEAVRTSGASTEASHDGALYGSSAINTANNGKLGGTGNYFGLTLKSGYYFQNGDKLYLKLNTKNSNGDGIVVTAGLDGTGDVVGSLANASQSTDYANEITLSNVPASTSSIVIYRTGTVNQNPYIDAMKVKRYVCPDSKEFLPTGDDGNWNATANWIGEAGRGASLPTIEDRVIISKPVTVDIADAKAQGVLINQYSGATGKITVSAGKALIIAETLKKTTDGSTKVATAAADVVINSTRAAGGGALIIGGETGSNAATMNFETQAKLVGGSTVNQFIGSPFSNTAPYVDYGQQLYKFCPKQNGDRGWWQSHESETAMTPFWGYNVLCPETSFLDLNWTGTLNASTTKTITDFYYNGSSETDNMFANSWTAPIHVGAFEDGDFVNASTTLYMFNAGTPAQEAGHSDADAANNSTEPGTYISIPIHSAPYAGIGVIPSMQAFYVLATGSGASLTLDYNKIVYTPALTSVGITPNRAPRRDVEVDEPEVIKLRVESETGWAANTYVLGRADFAEGYEDGWDGAYIEGESATPKLYTPSVDGNMFVNCLPQIDGTVVGFRKGSADSQYTFTFGYEGNEEYYLKDLKLDTETRIDGEHSYTFTAEAEDNAARFIIIRKTPTIATGVEDVENGTVVVRKLIIDDKVYIIRGGMMYDVTGKMIK